MFNHSSAVTAQGIFADAGALPFREGENEKKRRKGRRNRWKETNMGMTLIISPG